MAGIVAPPDQSALGAPSLQSSSSTKSLHQLLFIKCYITPGGISQGLCIIKKKRKRLVLSLREIHKLKPFSDERRTERILGRDWTRWCSIFLGDEGVLSYPQRQSSNRSTARKCQSNVYTDKQEQLAQEMSLRSLPAESVWGVNSSGSC